MTHPDNRARSLAVFRCDGSAAIGGGHVQRCLTLAEALAASGWRCAFAVGSATPAVMPRLADSVERLLVLDGLAEDEPARMADAFGNPWDLLVVDHYRRDHCFESACRRWAKRILVIDDLADRRHDADVLLDQTLGRNAAEYAALVPAHCRVLAGPSFALIRPAFSAGRGRALARREQSRTVARILVAIGLTDPDNVTSLVLEGIRDSGLTAAVDVVLGAGAPHLRAITDQVAAMSQETRIHVDCADIAQRMVAADLAIGAAGITAWERCCLGLPSQVIVTADNQRQAAAMLASTGACIVIGRHRDVMPAMIAGSLCALATDHDRRRAMARAAARVCDGRGVTRLLAELGLQPSAERESIALRPASLADGEAMLAWQRDPRTRRFAFNPHPPRRDEHERWLAERLRDPRTILNMITCDGEPAGVVRLDRRTVDGIGDAYEVSIFVAPDRYRRGIASGGLARCRDLLPEAVLVARVKPGNTASEALFAHAGYRRRDGWLIHGPASEERGR
ncbi:MAG: UDP-2,4-diacetamido-2,4,6-trideoxy-beta-L-altropyranose hydrolase [Rhodospirillales bacterium]